MLKQIINKSYKYLFVILIVCWGIYGNYDIINLKGVINSKDIELNSLQDNLNNQKLLEGKYIWEVFNIEQDQISNFIEQNNLTTPYIFVFVDSIDCFSCFKFHMKHLNKIRNIKKVIFSSSLNTELIISYINNGKIFKWKGNQTLTKPNVNENSNIIISLVAANGKILYADVADKTNYEKSNVFYKIISRFTNK